MSKVTGTTPLQVLAVETSQEDYLVAQGTALFSGKEIEIEAYGRAAEELAANQNSKIIAQVKMLGGSNNPRLKVERIISVAAPVVDTSDERIEQVKKVLKLKTKDSKPKYVSAVKEAMAILDS